MTRLRLTLYVSGSAEESARTGIAIKNLDRVLSRIDPSDYTLRVVDVRLEPELAEARKILATPMLVREVPLPSKRLLGDLSNTLVVARALRLEIDTSDLGPDEFVGSYIY